MLNKITAVIVFASIFATCTSMFYWTTNTIQNKNLNNQTQTTITAFNA